MAERPSTFDFDAKAECYDRWYATPHGAMYDRLEKRAVAGLLPTDGPTGALLEVGCGTGHWSRFFSRQGFDVTGVDVSPATIRIAREKAIPRALFAIADAHRLPFDSQRFDVAAAITTLEFVRDAEAVVREMVRCTKRPGGLVLVGVLNALARVNRRRKATGKPTYAHARFFSPREVASLLAHYGRPRVTSTGFVPRARRLLGLAPLTNAIGRVFHLPYGVFVAGRVEL